MSALEWLPQLTDGHPSEHTEQLRYGRRSRLQEDAAQTNRLADRAGIRRRVYQ